MNKIAKIAGFLYLLLIPLGIFGIIYVPSLLIIPGDIVATINNISENEFLFRLSILSALVVQLVNMLVVYFLYKLLQGVNKTCAIFMVIFLLLAVPIAFINELNHGAVLLSLGTSNESLIPFFLSLHESGIYLAQIFWGLWLFPMGYLVYKSHFIPKIIGIFLMIGCFGYMIDSIIFFLNPGFGITFSEFTFFGEILFPLWLIFKGVEGKK